MEWNGEKMTVQLLFLYVGKGKAALVAQPSSFYRVVIREAEHHEPGVRVEDEATAMLGCLRQ
jgi:hypothetical protein